MGKSSKASPGPRDHGYYFDQQPDATGRKDQNAKKNSEQPGGGDAGRRMASLRD
jgi:hypothetical protein